jgi:hypothetical protein
MMDRVMVEETGVENRVVRLHQDKNVDYRERESWVIGRYVTYHALHDPLMVVQPNEYPPQARLAWRSPPAASHCWGRIRASSLFHKTSMC